ncbi:uncharacterized protein LOC111053061 isoform X3 [Nilaparvata lugens]|uniref:uncharacterized protein LOC111053061 isoform X3 n=1 Tax=Nilaparvata lugens TaxID=108931 RepID=UPI00193DA657|nr:uncharacterized protein LOC111053061 isoform X3 [Nilaparvata lugens]
MFLFKLRVDVYTRFLEILHFKDNIKGKRSLLHKLISEHVNGVCAGVLTIKQPFGVQWGYNVVITLLPPEDPSKTKFVHGDVRCVLMNNIPYADALPHFNITTKISRANPVSVNKTGSWYLVDDHPLTFYNCTTQDISFYRIKAIYSSIETVLSATYPDDEGVEVEEVGVSAKKALMAGITVQITFRYYRSLENNAKDEVKLANGTDVTIVTGNPFNAVKNFVKGHMKKHK